MPSRERSSKQPAERGSGSPRPSPFSLHRPAMELEQPALEWPGVRPNGHDFARIAVDVPRAAHDAHEREADAVADRVLSAPQIGFVQAKRVESGGPSPGPVSPAVQATLSQSGQRLDAGTRGYMESRFGHDFGDVRVLTGATAHAAARSVGARAFTVGSRIAFREGAYAPSTGPGRQLLAHELTHVLQQRSGPHRLQRKGEGEEEAEQGVLFWFSVKVDRVLGPAELMVELIKQYRRVDEATAKQIIKDENWHAVDPANPDQATQEDVDRGHKLIHVRDYTLRGASKKERDERKAFLGGLSQAEQAAITRETDRQFWERTQYRPGEGLGNSPEDKQMAQYWLLLRDELIRQRKAIEDLPEEIKKFLFKQTGRKMQPGDFATILRLADKLMQLTPAERQSYLDKTTGRTEDPAVFEAALDRYMGELIERREASEERERTKASLLGLDDVYRQYRDYMSMLKTSAGLASPGMAPGAGLGTSLGMQPTLNKMREELTANLQRHGYNSISDFEAAIKAFEAAFQAETVLIAQDMMDRYDHILVQQEERYRKSGEVQKLHKSLGGARGHYEEAHRIREEHASMPMTPEEMADQAYWSGEFWREMGEGARGVSALGGEHPLLKNTDVPAEELALAGEGDVGDVIQGYIKDRRKDIQKTRENLRDKPAMIWHLDKLLERSMVDQDIQPNSLYHLIIQDHIRDQSIERALIGLAIAVIAIAAGLVSAGTGTVAVLGAASAFGLGAYQAWEEYRRYEEMSAAHGAQLLSEDPSFAWVIVAVVGAGLDLAAVGVALKTIKPAVEAFNKTGDVVALEKELRLLAIDEELTKNVVRAARAEAEATEAWKLARAQNAFYAAIDPIVTPVLILGVRFAYPMYLSVRRGIISLERFLLTREAVSLIGDYRKLSPEALAKVRAAYQLALTDAQRLAAHGHSLGLLDSEIERFLLLWNRQPDLKADDIARQMEQFAGPLLSRPGARARIAPDLILDPKSRALLPDFEQQIAGTGGIESIKAATTTEGRLAVTIEGEILPGRLTRDPKKVTPTRRVAPSFNTSSKLFKPKEAGLTGDWQRLHLWGPGFGDEAAAGMMWGPRNVNLVWQNDSIESYIRQMSELAAMRGGRTRVKATAIAWENPTPKGFSAPQGENFLKRVQYDITLIRPGQPDTPIRVTLDVAEPPSLKILSFEIDPPGAANPADLF